MFPMSHLSASMLETSAFTKQLTDIAWLLEKPTLLLAAFLVSFNILKTTVLAHATHFLGHCLFLILCPVLILYSLHMK